MAGVFIFIMPSPSLFHFLGKTHQEQSCTESCIKGWFVLLQLGMTVIQFVINKDGFIHLTALLFKEGSYGYSCMVMVISGYDC